MPSTAGCSSFLLLSVVLQIRGRVKASVAHPAERKLMRSMTTEPYQLMPDDKGIVVEKSDSKLQMAMNTNLSQPLVATYEGHILGDAPSFYLRFEDNADDSSDNMISTTIIGAAKYQHCSGHKAGRFGHDMFRVNAQSVIPINRNLSGYQERSIEMWFQVRALSGHWGPWANNLTLYEEGSNETGIHIFTGCCNSDGQATLYMFMYNRVQNGSESYGTADVDPEPITCNFAKDESHYAVFVFDGDNVSADGNHTPTYSAYLGWPGGSEGVKHCGARLIGDAAGRNNSWRANIKLPYHEGVAAVGGIDGDARFSATSDCAVNCEVHDFDGVIDELAIYNTALTVAQMEHHFDAGKYGEICMPGPEDGTT